MRPSSFPVLLSAVAIVAACGGAPAAETAADKSSATIPRKPGTCAGSSMVTTMACAKRTVPPSNATSDYGCKSDAECKDGIEGRCVKNALDSYGSRVRPVPSPLLAGPPPPPPKTICTYDRCNTNADCGAQARCSCGEGTARNTCVPLDACRGDAECGKDRLCTCGAGGGPNACTAANCRTSADCADDECTSGRSGTYCHSSKDKCKTDKDCAADGDYRICDYDRDMSQWTCRMVPPIPPG